MLSCLFLDSEGKSESETQTYTLDMRLGKQEIELEAKLYFGPLFASDELSEAI